MSACSADERVGDLDAPGVRVDVAGARAVDHGRGGAALERRADEAVAVGARAAQREEELARAHLARVDRGAREQTLAAGHQQPAVHRCRGVTKRARHHGSSLAHRPAPRTSSIAFAASS